MTSSQPASSQTFQGDDTVSTLSDSANHELSDAVEDMLNAISSKFTSVSEDILAKMDDMARRLDNLEAVIQVGSSSPSKQEK